MQKVKVLPELYLPNNGMCYVVSEDGTVYCATAGMLGYIRSGFEVNEFKAARYRVATIKMRWVYVDE